MARARILNPVSAPLRHEPGELSNEILAEARASAGADTRPRLADLTGELHAVAPERIEGDDARIAFWINIYNALVLHCFGERPMRGSLLWHLGLFDRIAYRIGSHDYPLNVIENGLLRMNRRPPHRLKRRLRAGDRRLVAAPSRVEPRLHFALNCGARSCPPVRVYEPASLDAQLDKATRAYLETETRLEPENRRLSLPRLMRIYAEDFGDRRQQVAFAARYLPAVAGWLRDDGSPVRVRYGRFDWAIAPLP